MAFTIILTPYWTAVTDAFHRNDFKWIKDTYSSLNKILFLFFGIIAVQILVSKIFFKLWINNEVIISLPLLLSIAFFIAVLMCSNLYSTFFNGLGKLKIQLFIALGEGICYIGCLFLLIPLLGLIAVPLSLGITMFFGTLVYRYNFVKLIRQL